MDERFGRRIYSLTYRHADGRDYRHDFKSGAELRGQRDGTVRIVSRNGRAWDRFGDKGFLVNPARGGTKLRVVCAWCSKVLRAGSPGAPTSHTICAQCTRDHFPNPARVARRRDTRGKMKKSRKARGVPAWVRARGFTTWASYFKSIRGGGKVMAKKRRAKRGGGKRRHRRAASAAPRHNPARRGRRRYRHNPGFSPKGIIRDVTQLAIGGARDGLVGTASLASARIVRGKLLNLEGNTIPGIGVELGLGLLQAVILKRIFGENVARAAMQGVTQGVVTTAVKGAGIPYLSPGLGDEGELPLLSGIYDLSGVYDLSGANELNLLTGGDDITQRGVNVGADADLM